MNNNIAILLATYNGEAYISEQIESIINQDYDGDYCLYISDDGSTDDTKKIALKYKKKYPDTICIFDNKEKHGAKYNFISLLGKVNANYYMFCDQDDVWKQNKIKESISLLKMIEDGGNQPSLVFSDLEVVDADLNLLHESFLKMKKRNPEKYDLKSLLKENVAAGCTMIFNSRLRDIAIRLSNVSNIAMHDIWLISCASLFGRIGFLDDSTLLYRQHGSNVLGAKVKSSEWMKEKMLNIIRGRQIERSIQGISYIKGMCSELYKISNDYGIEIDEDSSKLIQDILSNKKLTRMNVFFKNKYEINNVLGYLKLFIV